MLDNCLLFMFGHNKNLEYFMNTTLMLPFGSRTLVATLSSIIFIVIKLKIELKQSEVSFDIDQTI